MKISGHAKLSALTLVDLMVSMACGLILLAAVIAAGVALERSCAAAESYRTAEGNQLRILDYVAMDARRCYSAAVTTDANGIYTLTLTVPSMYDASGNLVDPQFDSNGAIGYGNPPATTTIKYYQSGTNFVREIVGISTTAIAANVADFTLTLQDLTSSVTCSITFLPKFASSGANNTAGTTLYCKAALRNARAWQ